MKKVLIVGPLMSNSGYGVHSRQVFNALFQRKNIDLYVKVTGGDSWLLKGKDIENILNLSKKSNQQEFDESYQIGIPSNWNNIAKKNIGITAGFESNIVKSSWLDNINAMDAIIVPSEFTRLSFVNASKRYSKNILTSIKVINEWYYSDIDIMSNFSSFVKNLKYKKNILLVGKLSNISNVADRKNTIKTLLCCLDFVKDKKIGVILKASINSDSVSDKEKLKTFIKNNVPEKLLKNKLSIIVKSLTKSQMIKLYSDKKVSCFVSGTRGEGFGLPFLESASLGLPIIATDYSAYKEFLENDFLKVEYDLKDIGFIDKTFIDEDSSPVWAEFRSSSLKQNLDLFFKNTTKYKLVAKKRQKIIKQKLCKRNIIGKYNIFFESLEWLL